jgi:4-amino-4-deoxy-L-arabinose transferase-like glycosyltransferase
MAVAAGALVLVAIAMRLNNALRYPSLHGYDSYAHATYIWHLLKAQTVPLASDGWGRFHPPLYYLLCAGLWWTLAWLEPRTVLKIISATFSMLGLLSAFVSYRLARMYFPKRPILHLAAPLFVLFLPVHLYTAPMLGNESLNTVICSLALMYMVMTLRTERNAPVIVLGIVLGLGLLTKFTSVVYVMCAGVVLLIWFARSHKWKRLFAWTAILAVSILIIAGPFYARNMRVYGNPVQMSRDYFATQRIENTITKGRRDLAAYTSFDTRILRNPTYISGPVLNSVWTGAFATTWYDAEGGWFLPFALGNPVVTRIGQALLILGLVPTILVLVGMAEGVRHLIVRGWDDVLVCMAAATVLMLALFVVYTYENRIFTAVKASYLLPAVVPFSFWFTLGLDVSRLLGRACARAIGAALGALVLLIIPVFSYQLFFELPHGSYYWNSVAVIDDFAGFREQARSLFERVSDVTDLFLAHENLASLALEDGDRFHAIVELKRARNVLPRQLIARRDDKERWLRLIRAEYSNTLAVIYQELGWDEIAFKAARNAVSLNAALPEAQYDLAVMLLEKGLAASAAGALERAIDLDPGFREAYTLLAIAQAESGDCDGAMRTIERITTMSQWPRRTFPYEVGNGDIHDAAIVRRRRIRHLPETLQWDQIGAHCRHEAARLGRRRHLPS